MAVSDIFSRIIKSNPDCAQQPRELWIERIRRVLKENFIDLQCNAKGKQPTAHQKKIYITTTVSWIQSNGEDLPTLKSVAVPVNVH